MYSNLGGPSRSGLDGEDRPLSTRRSTRDSRDGPGPSRSVRSEMEKRREKDEMKARTELDEGLMGKGKGKGKEREVVVVEKSNVLMV